MTVTQYFWLLLSVTAPLAAFAREYCNCQYDVPLDWEPDCRAYGQLGDGNLIPWYRANQTCLDDLKIKIAAMSRVEMFSICPFANSTNANIQLLMNAIRFNPSPATRAVQAYYPQFWVESNVTAGDYELADVVYDTRNSATPPCDESPSLCWGVITDYFTVTPEATATICKELHDRQVFNMDLEQSTTRIRLCSDAPDTPASCEPLQSQVAEIKVANAGKACSAFGLGPASSASKLPQCVSGQVARSTSTTTSGAMTARLLHVGAALTTVLLPVLL
jgi:hypothetical protein